jgi:glycosyltransferase involved in cell wall biosynthesis
MHIAWLGKKTPFCGNVTYGREVTNALLDRGHPVSFLHFAQPELAHAPVKSSCAEIALPFLYKSQVYTIPTLKSSRVLMRSLQHLKPDLVHASLTLSTLDFRLPDLCTALNIPLVATFHPPFDSKIRNLKSSTQYLTYQFYAPFLAHYDRVIVFSNIQKDLLVRLGVPASRVTIIPNGVDIQKYCPGPSPLKTRLNAERLYVYMGRIATEKNVEAMLKAWKQTPMGPRTKLLIVGDGPLAASLKQLYGPQDGIIWYGYEANEQRRIEILRAADVFILPSLVEGLSLALLEAMACGVACIATDAGADGEVIDQGAGMVMDTHDVTGQLKTLLPICRDHPELVKLLGQKARERVLDRYTLHYNMTRLEHLYSEVVGVPVVEYNYSQWASS